MLCVCFLFVCFVLFLFLLLSKLSISGLFLDCQLKPRRLVVQATMAGKCSVTPIELWAGGQCKWYLLAYCALGRVGRQLAGCLVFLKEIQSSRYEHGLWRQTSWDQILIPPGTTRMYSGSLLYLCKFFIYIMCILGVSTPWLL